MTTITLVQEEDTPTVNRALLTTITALLMIVALMGAFSLLNWALDVKQANYSPATSSDITAEVRERQLGCLAKNIYHEAGSEPFEGKIAVAQVTMNRVNSSQFPGDVCKVIYQKNIFYEKVVCQFSWVCDKVTAFKPKNRANYDESMIAAQKVLLEDYRLPSLKNALYYHADYINPGWKKEQVAKIGHHIFYK